jgi:hypothetical protein|tara:strand:- start:318 stop:701 length:384 start_codon:yes stop_codon:yes gene_type:complete
VQNQKVEALARLERMHKNLDTGMTRLKYLNMCEQLEQEPIENEIPPDWEDFPEVVQHAINTFNQLGDRVFPEIGFVGKDYTNLSHYLEVYDVNDKEFFLEILSWLDSRAIKKSSEDLKRQYDKLKRK